MNKKKAKNKKQIKKHSGKLKTSKNLFKKWYFWVAAVILIVLIIFLAIFIPKKLEEQRILEEEARISAEIEACISSIGIDSLEFKATCYESRERQVPDDVKESDKRKADMIIAQAYYDDCKAYAKLRKDGLWDLNDTSPDNLTLDPISSSMLNFVNTEYVDTLRSCDEKYALSEPYNNNWDTLVSYRLTGWVYDYTNIYVFDLENSQGKIPEAIGIRADERLTTIPKSVGSVAYMAAYDFKQKHNNWWY